MRNVWNWVATILALAAVAMVLIVYHPVLRVAARLGRRHEERQVARLNRTIVRLMRIAGVTVDVEVSGAIEPGRGYVIVANHQSMLDIPLFLGFFPDERVTFVAKDTLSRGIPSVSFHLRYSGSALIDRDNPRQSLRAIRDCGAFAEARGASVVIYPEGTRSRDGKLQVFHPAGTVTLLKAAPSLPVVPAAVDGSWEVFRHNLLPVPFGTRVRVWFGNPIDRPVDGEDHRALVALARDEVAATLSRWRGET